MSDASPSKALRRLGEHVRQAVMQARDGMMNEQVPLGVQIAKINEVLAYEIGVNSETNAAFVGDPQRRAFVHQQLDDGIDRARDEIEQQRALSLPPGAIRRAH